MTIFPHQIGDVMQLYNRVAKLKPSTLLEREDQAPGDVITISDEAKKQRVLAQAKTEVLARIRNAK